VNTTKTEEQKEESSRRGRQQSAPATSRLGGSPAEEAGCADRKHRSAASETACDPPKLPFIGRVAATVMPIVSGLGRVIPFWE
jgi:hypothetical protein